MHDSMRSQLARAVNFRSLCGIPVRGGTIKRGIVYRSAGLSQLGAPEREAMRALDIRAIFDLRYNAEREEYPTPWRELGCAHYWAQDYQPKGGGDLKDILNDTQMAAQKARDMMLRVYETLPYMLTNSLKYVFQTVAAGEGAFLFHCTHGKDRTGITAAAMLSVLGADRDAIFADYLATANYDVYGTPMFTGRYGNFPADRRDALRPILGVEAAYLEVAFKTLADRHGSVEGYLTGPVGLTTADLDAFRKRLLA